MISGVHSILLVLSVSNNLLEDLFSVMGVMTIFKSKLIEIHAWKNRSIVRWHINIGLEDQKMKKTI